MTRDELNELQSRIDSLRNHGEDYLIIEVGTYRDEMERVDGFAVATVQMGNDKATARGKYLDTAISLARSAIIRQREAKTKAAKEKKDQSE